MTYKFYNEYSFIDFGEHKGNFITDFIHEEDASFLDMCILKQPSFVWTSQKFISNLSKEAWIELQKKYLLLKEKEGYSRDPRFNTDHYEKLLKKGDVLKALQDAEDEEQLWIWSNLQK